ncbi:MAG: D-alanine--D-alanine ligase family protein [Patescibacteria group bacterium]
MKKLAILFGGISTEHEVSVITALQLIKNADKNKYEILPIYIDKSGNWWTGEKLLEKDYYKDQNLFKPKKLEPFSTDLQTSDIDVAILCFHGEYGEGGNIQGLLELAGIPYQGPGVLGSAVAMDKISFRQILKAEGISQADFLYFTQADFDKNKKEIFNKIVNNLKLPVYIKPSRSGSSIGVVKVDKEKELDKKIKEALKLDSRILVEKEIEDCIEINVAVLGDQEKAVASVAEQPIKSEELLSFADKYEKGSGKKSGMASATRRIPAPISSELTKKAQDLALRIFKIFDFSGVVRTDFFVNPSTEEIFVTESNTIPGSMSFYLFEADGMDYSELIDKLVEIAINTHKRKGGLIKSFDTNILEK